MREREPWQRRWGAVVWGPPALAILSDEGCGAGAQKWGCAETLPQSSEWGEGRRGGARFTHVVPPLHCFLLADVLWEGHSMHFPVESPAHSAGFRMQVYALTRDISFGPRSGGGSRHFLCDWWSWSGDSEEGEVQAHTGQVPINSCLQDLSLVAKPSLNFENRKHLVLICLAISAEPHTHISGCPVNVFFTCFVETADETWKSFSVIFKTFFFLASLLVPDLAWSLNFQSSTIIPSIICWSSMVTVIFHSQGCCSGTSTLNCSNRLLIGLLGSTFSLSAPSYYCCQTGVPKNIPLIMSHGCTRTFADSPVTGVKPIAPFLCSLPFILGPHLPFQSSVYSQTPQTPSSGKLSATTYKHRKWKEDIMVNFIWLPLWTVLI